VRCNRDVWTVHRGGDAGDVYLCHPFLVHAATWPHRGKAPRFIAQPPLTPVGLLDLDRARGDYSPVEWSRAPGHLDRNRR
jgi:hypothetical protein